MAAVPKYRSAFPDTKRNSKLPHISGNARNRPRREDLRSENYTLALELLDSNLHAIRKYAAAKATPIRGKGVVMFQDEVAGTPAAELGGGVTVIDGVNVHVSKRTRRLMIQMEKLDRVVDTRTAQKRAQRAINLRETIPNLDRAETITFVRSRYINTPFTTTSLTYFVIIVMNNNLWNVINF